MPVAPVTIGIARIDTVGTERTIVWTDGTSNVFPSNLELNDFIDDGQEPRVMAQRLLLWNYREQSPTFANDNLIEGKQCTIDGAQNLAPAQFSQVI